MEKGRVLVDGGPVMRVGKTRGVRSGEGLAGLPETLRAVSVNDALGRPKSPRVVVQG